VRGELNMPVAWTPTADKPLLLGLLTDVSGSMATSIQNDSRPGRSRLDSLRDSLDDLIARAAKLCVEGVGGNVSPRMRLFAYGFGFGGPLAFFLGGGDSVQDLLSLGSGPESAVGIDELARDWQIYRDHIGGLVPKMGGDTPMTAAFRIAKARVKHELSLRSYSGSPILFVVSDGVPTDASTNDVIELARDLKNAGIVVVSCLLTDDDITKARHLYGTIQDDWPEGARLMFECASFLPDRSPFDAYFVENRWTIERDSKLFTQINTSAVLEEFSKVVLSPLDSGGDGQPTAARSSVRVFVTYSHADAKYLEKDSLLGYLSALENEGVEFFTDRDIAQGELWNDRILGAIKSTDVVLALVSQAFLNSRYCQEVEIAKFLASRAKRGTKILPVILSPCDWRSHNWLVQTQALPRDGKTLEVELKSKGKRQQLFLDVLMSLRTAAQEVRSQA
jgi:hypothetical protein